MNTGQFIETIESISGIIPLPPHLYEDGVHLRFYQSLPPRKRVVIDTSDETIEDDIGRNYLIQLGLPDLIPALFPEEVIQEIPAEIEKEKPINQV